MAPTYFRIEVGNMELHVNRIFARERKGEKKKDRSLCS